MFSSTHTARSTGTSVSVFSAADEQVDPGDGETKWYTMCNEHYMIMGYTTLAGARKFASHPEVWCEVCSGATEAYL